jgi:hypothetical protein
MAKQNEWQRSTDPRDSRLGDEERIRGVGDTGEPDEDAADADEDDFDDAEDLGNDDDEEASF